MDFLLTNAEESVKINFAVTQGAGVAQLAEQLICNQQVGGSIPFTSSILYFIVSSYGGVPEWPKGADCKSVVVDFGGSNPPSSTIISTIVERTNPHSITSGDLFFLFELSRGLEVHVVSVFIHMLSGFITNAFTEHWVAKDLLNLGSQSSKFYPKKVLPSQSGLSSPPTMPAWLLRAGSPVFFAKMKRVHWQRITPSVFSMPPPTEAILSCMQRRADKE